MSGETLADLAENAGRRVRDCQMAKCGASANSRFSRSSRAKCRTDEEARANARRLRWPPVSLGRNAGKRHASSRHCAQEICRASPIAALLTRTADCRASAPRFVIWDQRHAKHQDCRPCRPLHFCACLFSGLPERGSGRRDRWTRRGSPRHCWRGGGLRGGPPHASQAATQGRRCSCAEPRRSSQYALRALRRKRQPA